jgi:hypothetical protein
VLATVYFDAGLNACDSVLHLQNVILTDTAGDPPPDIVNEDGLVHVFPCPDPTCPEDVNCDGVINILDIMQVASKWGQTCPTLP